MRCGLRLWIFVHLVCVVAVHATRADEFFVSIAGSDLAAGSLMAPWRTLQHAADKVQAGDHVVVQPGTYVGFNLTTSGAAASPIEFFAEPGVVIDQRNATTSDGINLEGASHVIIDGFEVVDMPRAGVRTVGFEDAFASNVTIRNVTAANNFKWGIFTGFVDDLLIENNRASGSVDEHGIYVSNSGDRPVIRHNEIWGNHANGIHMNGDLSLGGDGIISDAVVSGNIIHDNGLGGGSGINMDGVQNSRIENNLLYNNHASGISLYQIDGAAGSTGNVVVNNTVHQADDGRWALNIQNASSNNTILNNILLSEHSYRGALDVSADSLAGLTSDYNVVISRFTTNGGDSVESLSEWQALTALDFHSVVAAPEELFVNWSVEDYYLLPTAVARDSGTSAEAPNVDLAGLSRPWGVGFDRGAYEYSALAADLDGDGDVDGIDFLLIQRTDPSLISTWQNEFGAGIVSQASSEAVPEPSSLLLSFAASMVWMFRVRKLFLRDVSR